MLSALLALTAVLLVKYWTKWAWIWVIPNGASFGLGLAMSLNWLGGQNVENLPLWDYRILGLAPVFLWFGPAVGYLIYKKFRRVGIANIPVFISWACAAYCISYVADSLPK